MSQNKKIGDISSLQLHTPSDNDMAGKMPEDAPEEVIPPTPDIKWDSTGSDLAEEKLKGAPLIQEFVKRLPNKPGVYRMFDDKGDVLYVGKAKNLKKRVSNYARGSGHSNRIERMIRATCNMEFVVTRTETEALLLEANLIKRLRPRFNILLRDDKSFPYIVITGNTRAPGLFKHRGAHSLKGDYFGPFASSGAVTRTVNAMQRAFLLRTCTDSVLESRTRPCLLYQIKRCSAPCTHEISHDDYAKLVDEAKAFLSGKSQSIMEDIAHAMHEASAALDFEHAAVYRDRLSALSHIQTHQGINPQTINEADVFAIFQQGGLTCIQVFFFRTGQNWGNCAYFPKADVSITSDEILSAFIAQFYDNKPVPKLLLLSEAIEDEPLLADALSIKAEHKVQITVPQRGEKKELIDHALTNAREALGRRLAETSTQAKLLKALAETFNLEKVPTRIEVYDNSHIQGTNAVGGMIVAGAEGFIKNQYRKFNIRSTDMTPGDDVAMMREVMERRFSRLLKEHGDKQNIPDDEDSFPSWPDLILIDGGEGQMRVVWDTLKELGLDEKITAIGVAKGMDREAGRERFSVKGRPTFSLPPRDPVLYFIERLRDEAHRYAIGSHRARRKKEMIKNPLDEIEGIGPARKRALLSYFGTAKAVARAAIEDLIKVEGISEATAQIIHDHFNET